MFHTLAFTASAGAGLSNVDIPGITDQFAPLNAASHYIFPMDYRIQAIYGLGAGLVNAQLLTPSLRAPCQPRISPLERSATPISIPSIQDFRPYGPTIPKTDEIAIQASNNAGAGDREVFLMWLGDGNLNVPQGRIFPIRFTATTAAGNLIWSPATIAFDQVLQHGNYAVVGAAIYTIAAASNCVAARLVFPSGGPRPGVIAMPGVGLQGWDQLRSGRMGTFGTFFSTAPPTLEYFGTAALASNLEGVLDLIRVGDMG